MKKFAIFLLATLLLGACAVSKKNPTKKAPQAAPVSDISKTIFDIIKELDETALSQAVEGRFGGIKATNAQLVDTVINKIKDKLDGISPLIWDDYKQFTLEHKNDAKEAVYIYKLPPISEELQLLAKNEKKPEERKNDPRGQLISLSSASQNFLQTAGSKFSAVFIVMRNDFKKKMETETDFQKVEKEIIETAKLQIRSIFKDYYGKLLSERIQKL